MWLGEGDLALVDAPAPWGEEYEYGFVITGRRPPKIEAGERVYIVAHARLRGYAPLVGIGDGSRFGGKPASKALIRRNGAVAVTRPGDITGFQGWRYRWWERDEEIPFPDWRFAGVR